MLPRESPSARSGAAATSARRRSSEAESYPVRSAGIRPDFGDQNVQCSSWSCAGARSGAPRPVQDEQFNSMGSGTRRMVLRASGALELCVTGRGVFVGEQSAAQAMGFLNDPMAVMIAAQQETYGLGQKLRFLGHSYRTTDSPSALGTGSKAEWAIETRSRRTRDQIGDRRAGAAAGRGPSRRLRTMRATAVKIPFRSRGMRVSAT